MTTNHLHLVTFCVSALSTGFCAGIGFCEGQFPIFAVASALATAVTLFFCWRAVGRAGQSRATD